MNADGTAQTRLTNNSASDGLPMVSPNGQKIAFTAHRDGNFEIYTMNADGAGQTRLTNNAATTCRRPAPPTPGSSLCFEPRRQQRDLPHERRRLGNRRG